MHHIIGIVVGAVLFAGAAQAQDAVSVGQGIYKKVTENDRVRVLEAEFPPGAKMPMHRHPDHMLYMLTEGTLVLKPEGRKAYEMTLTAGEAVFLPAQVRASENDTDRTVRMLVVEFKAGAAARPNSRAAKGKGARRGRAVVKPRG